MSRPSILTEIGAVYAGLETTGAGLDAFRQGDAAVTAHAERLGPSIAPHELVSVALLAPTGNAAIEAARINHPLEFEFGSMVRAFNIRKGQQL